MRQNRIEKFRPWKVGFLISLFFISKVIVSCSDDHPQDDTDLSEEDTHIEFPPIDLEAPANNNLPFTFQNYLGNIQNIHPKVLYFENGWCGYRFWMAYTPYPKGNTKAENPCIAVSNNGVDWTVPCENLNPLADVPESGYNSDTHLVYDEKNDRLECWWREYSSSLKRDRLLRRVSDNGEEWNETEIVSDFQEDPQMRLSPAVNIVDGRYLMIYSDGKDLWRQDSHAIAPAIEWTAPVKIEQPATELSSWHLDMIIGSDRKAEIIECAFGKGGNNNTADLYYLTYDIEGGEVSEPQLILARSNDKNGIDSRSIYRSSIVKVEERYLIYYSCIDEDWNRFMSLTWGYSPTDLHAYPFEL